MCIRDRDNSVEFRILEEPLLVTGLGIAFAKDDSRGLDTQLNAVLAQMRTDGTLEPVSYTHLDVYKRQLQCSSNGSTTICFVIILRSLVGLPVVASSIPHQIQL